MTDAIRLDKVCTFADDRTNSMGSPERTLRHGPYPLYAENCIPAFIEDWEFEAGGTVMVPAFGSVLASDGRLMAFYEPGRCSATTQVLPLIPNDPADGRYIWRALTTFKAPSACVGGTSQLRQLAIPSLRCARIPWPERPVRDAYVEALDRCEERIAALIDVPPALLAEGDEAFAATVVSAGAGEMRTLGDLAAWHTGTSVPAADRGAEKPVSVEGPLGELGRCDEALADGRCIVLGTAARKVLAHVCPGPCHPIAETVYASDGDCAVPQLVAFFALRAAGIPDRVRLDGQQTSSPARTLEDAMSVAVPLGDPGRWDEFLATAETIVGRIEAAEAERKQAIEDRIALIVRFERDGEIDGDLAEKYGVTLGTGTDGAASAVGGAADADTVVSEGGADGVSARARWADSPLGTLSRDILANSSLTGDDAAWEIAPIAMLRARLRPELWGALVSTARDVADGGKDADLSRFVDIALADVAARSELLSFADGFSYATSQFSNVELAKTVLAFDELGTSALDGDAMRGLLAYPNAPIEARRQLEDLVAAAIGACADDVAARDLVQMAYIPCDDEGLMADAAGRACAGFTLATQTPDILDALADALVRDRLVDGGGAPAGDPAGAPVGDPANSPAGSFAYLEGDPLTEDAFPSVKASLVLASLPPNVRDWTAAVKKDDPRWVLGTPPRNKANYAWLQHCLAHLVPGGVAVVVSTNAPLHSSIGCEQELRHGLARSGRLRMAVALPARMYADGSPARTLLVLGDEQPADSWRCLMVNTLDKGVPAAETPDGSPVRALPDALLSQLCRLCESWIARGEVADVDVPHAVVDMSAVEAADCLLVPWEYAR